MNDDDDDDDERRIRRGEKYLLHEKHKSNKPKIDGGITKTREQATSTKTIIIERIRRILSNKAIYASPWT